jgi:hypothetical protein
LAVGRPRIKVDRQVEEAQKRVAIEKEWSQRKQKRFWKDGEEWGRLCDKMIHLLEAPMEMMMMMMMMMMISYKETDITIH